MFIPVANAQILDAASAASSTNPAVWNFFHTTAISDIVEATVTELGTVFGTLLPIVIPVVIVVGALFVALHWFYRAGKRR